MNKHKEDYKEWLVQVFDRGSDQYGLIGPDFFSFFGHRLVERAGLVEGSAVLDIACGRGAVLFPAHNKVGPIGTVVGIDLSTEMVINTLQEVESRGLDGIQIQQMDAENLQFPAATFDYVLCGFALFFFPNIQRSLAEIRRVLKPGGVFIATTFGEEDSRWETFGEIIETYKDRFKPVPQTDRTAFDNADEIVAVLTQAYFSQIDVFSEEKEFYFADADEYWRSMWSHGGRALLERMDEGTLKEFKKDFFDYAQGFAEENGIPQLLRVLITRAIRPETGLTERNGDP